MSAIQRRDSPRPTLLVFNVSAKIAKPDIEMMAEAVQQAIDQFDTIDILLFLTHFDGADADAVFDREALGAQLRSATHVRKYGVVGAPGWARAMIEVSDFVSPVEAKTFDGSEEAQAWTWIEAA